MKKIQNQQKEEEKEKKRVITTFKYSKLGQGDLYEGVIFEDGLPVFIKHNDQTNTFESFDQIEETTRILVPPSYEECPYLRYEFDSLEEINSINKFIDDNNIDIDYFYNKGYLKLYLSITINYTQIKNGNNQNHYFAFSR